MRQPGQLGVWLLGQGLSGPVAAARPQAEGAGAAAHGLTRTLSLTLTLTLTLTLALALALTLAQAQQRTGASVAEEAVLEPPMFGRGMPPVCSCLVAFRRTPRVRRLLSHAAGRLALRLNPTDLTNPALHGARPP